MSDPTPNADRERLDRLEEEIEQVKRDVDQDIEPDADEPTYASSGETPEADDQTITPPG